MIDDYFGPVEVPVNPTRVVAADSITLGNMLALGVKPVATGVNVNSLPGYLQDQMQGVEDITTEDDIDLERALALNADLIISVGRTFSGVSRYRTDNISNARARGAELSASVRPHTALSIRANYTFLDSEILAVNGSSSAQTPYEVGDPLLRRPRHSGSLDASWTRNAISVFAQLQARGETLDAEPAFGPTGGLYTTDGHTVVNLGGSWRPVKALAVFARALNLFDGDYEEVLGYPAPGRTAYVGARVAVGR